MRKTALKAILEMARRDPRICFIGSDLGAGVMDDFGREMPDRLFREGISEQHVIGMAAGLAMDGKIVYVNTLATFLTRRSFEQILIDLGLHKAKVRLIGSGGGLVYAPLGPTHVTTEDLALMRLVPNMAVLAPCDAAEMARLLPATLDWEGPVYIRLAKGGDKVVSRDEPFVMGLAVSYGEAGDILLICTGIALQICLDAAELLRQGGLSAEILHLPAVKPLDAEAVLSRLPGRAAVLTVEEHSKSCGLGSAVAELLAEANLAQPPRFKRLGFPEAFSEYYGSQNDHLVLHGLSPEGVARAVKSLLARVGRR